MLRILLTILASSAIIWAGIAALVAIMDLEDRLATEQARAEAAEEARDAMLSGGRWVRAYDQKTGFSKYTFRPERGR